MKIMQLVVLPIVLFSITAYADSSDTFHFTSKDSTVHEQFHCTITKADSSNRVFGYNHAEMVKGFTPDGIIDTNVATINQFAFDAYHDDKYDILGTVNFKVVNKDAILKCAPGTAGRPLIPGKYGFSMR